MKPSELLRAGREQLGQLPRPRRRLGYSLVVGVGAAGGSRYLVQAHAPRLDLPHDAMLALIVTAGIVAIILGWRLIVFFERRDQRRQQMIAGLQNQKGEYRKLEDDRFQYTAWPMTPEASSQQAEPATANEPPSLRLVTGSEPARPAESRSIRTKSSAGGRRRRARP
jgi:hypothetical protein